MIYEQAWAIHYFVHQSRIVLVKVRVKVRVTELVLLVEGGVRRTLLVLLMLMLVVVLVVVLVGNSGVADVVSFAV